VFGPGGRTVVSPRVAPLREALRVATAGSFALRVDSLILNARSCH